MRAYNRILRVARTIRS
ncbi:hypothetical protein [Rickettsia asiatica]|nr:hypothetical protein [Rickettsia asiatica]